MPTPISDEAERVFFEIIDLPTTERTAYLTDLARNTPSLSVEVASLLYASEHGERMMSGAIGKMASSFLPEVGARIGVYQLVRTIGEGGMGVVFLAERADGLFDQQVAIKFVHGGSMAVARFLQERQILARLVHPNIARLIDGGITEDGTPYMVMEYFPGEPITRYCRDRQLPIAQRLRLFQQVCSAVDHAHRSLIIHRDLKPSNILVNEQGELKLLDFGIAKLLHHTPDESLTAEGGSFFTPDYASPEQIRAEQITTATDVYSLGAVLFELLSGARPHLLEKYTPPEITKVVCEDQPPDLGLGNELDQIVRMALRKEPERRYPSVNHLSEDIDRFLTEQPVRARADSFGYRARKFIRRNTFHVAAAASALLCLLAGSGLALWQARVARREAAAAERRFQQVRKVARIMLFDLEKQMRSLKGGMPARELLARTALEYLDSLYADTQHDVSLRREMAIAYERIGDVQGERARPNLGKPAEAIRNYKRSAELWDTVPETDRDFAACARVYFKLYDLAGGDEALQKALSSTDRAQAAAPGQPGTYQILIRRERLLGVEHLLRGEEQQSVERNTRALAFAEEWMSKQPGEVAELFVCGALESLANAYLYAGQPALAISTSERVAAIRRRYIEIQPNDPHHWRQLFRSHLMRARSFGSPFFAHLNRPRDAGYHYNQAIAIGRRLLEEDPLNAVTKSDLVEAYSELAQVTYPTSPSQAEALQQKALALSENLVKASPSSIVYRTSLARSHVELARIAYRPRQIETAAKHVNESLRILRAIAKDRPSEPKQNMLAPLGLRVHIALDAGNVQQAESDLRESLSIVAATKRGPAFGRNIPDIADVYSAAGRFHRHRNPALSRDYYRKCLALWDEFSRPGVTPGIAMQKRRQAAAALARF